MRGTITRALVIYAIFASIPFNLFAEPGPVTEREALARELRNAWLPLERREALTAIERHLLRDP